jgi:uncharacterized membrane protein YjjB (DUF3815 family)
MEDTMIIQTIAAVIAVYGCGYVLEIPKKLLLETSIIGGVGWMVYAILIRYENTTVEASFGAAMVIALLAHLAARIRKAPVTVFLIGGILPLVPGTGMYRTAYSVIRETPEKVYQNLQETLLIAGSIAVAIFIMDTVFRLCKFLYRKDKR